MNKVKKHGYYGFFSYTCGGGFFYSVRSVVIKLFFQNHESTNSNIKLIGLKRISQANSNPNFKLEK